MLKKYHEIEAICKKAKNASHKLAGSSNKERNSALKLIANQILKSINEIVIANKKDYIAAKKNNIPLHLLDRLLLNEERINNMAKDIINISKLEDPIGKELNTDYHEAITNIPAPSDNMKGKIIDVVEKGYFLNEKVIRYAKVVVANS